jgi:hypothetical protein
MSILRSAQKSGMTGKVDERVVRALLQRFTLWTLRCGRTSARIAIDHSTPKLGHSCSTRASSTFACADAPDRSLLDLDHLRTQRVALRVYQARCSRSARGRGCSSRPPTRADRKHPERDILRHGLELCSVGRTRTGVVFRG